MHPIFSYQLNTLPIISSSSHLSVFLAYDYHSSHGVGDGAGIIYEVNVTLIHYDNINPSKGT